MSAGEVKFARVRVSEVRAHSTNVRKNLGDLRDLCASIEPRTPSTTPRRPSRVSVRSLADVTTAWRHELKAGHVDVDDFLDALDRITTTGQIQQCYPPREQEAS